LAALSSLPAGSGRVHNGARCLLSQVKRDDFFGSFESARAITRITMSDLSYILAQWKTIEGHCVYDEKASIGYFRNGPPADVPDQAKIRNIRNASRTVLVFEYALDAGKRATVTMHREQVQRDATLQRCNYLLQRANLKLNKLVVVDDEIFFDGHLDLDITTLSTGRSFVFLELEREIQRFTHVNITPKDSTQPLNVTALEKCLTLPSPVALKTYTICTYHGHPHIAEIQRLCDGRGLKEVFAEGP
jgi:hypothetical protein